MFDRFRVFPQRHDLFSVFAIDEFDLEFTTVSAQVCQVCMLNSLAGHGKPFLVRCQRETSDRESASDEHLVEITVRNGVLADSTIFAAIYYVVVLLLSALSPHRYNFAIHLMQWQTCLRVCPSTYLARQPRSLEKTSRSCRILPHSIVCRRESTRGV